MIKALLVLLSITPLWASPHDRIPAPGEPNPFIMSHGQLAVETLSAFLSKKNPDLDPSFARFISALYIQEAAQEEVNHDIAFAQMLLETGFLRFGGQVIKEQNNFSGIGALDDGSPGAWFASPREGVRAHIQHLKAYGSTAPLKGINVDPRFHMVLRGSVLTYRGLTGKWATDQSYGDKLSALLSQLFELEGKKELAAQD